MPAQSAAGYISIFRLRLVLNMTDCGDFSGCDDNNDDWRFRSQMRKGTMKLQEATPDADCPAPATKSATGVASYYSEN
jgi:hypothetical protein